MASFGGRNREFVMHPEAQMACRALAAGFVSAVPGTVIFLVGLPGVGKTWIRHTVARQVYGAPDRWPPGRVPYIQVMSLLADRGYFSSKDLALSVLEQINAPTIDWLYQEPTADPSPYLDNISTLKKHAEIWRSERKPPSEREAWRSAIESGRNRQTQVLAIEHASLMVQNRKNGTAVQHTLNLMSIATAMGSSVLMTTTPEGCDLWSKYPEVNRRSLHIFLSPYDLETKTSRSNFAFLVKCLSRGMQFDPIDLPLLLLTAIGDATQTAADGVCRILDGALANARARGSEIIKRQDMQDAFPSPFEVENLRQSAKLLKSLQAPYMHPSFKISR